MKVGTDYLDIICPGRVYHLKASDGKKNNSHIYYVIVVVTVVAVVVVTGLAYQKIHFFPSDQEANSWYHSLHEWKEFFDRR